MPSTAYCPARRNRAHRQRGMVTLVAILFLIATVVFALSQMLNVSSGNVIDGQRQGDSTAAFFLAESGVDKAQAIVDAALAADSFTNATCTGLVNTYNAYSLGRGSFSLSGESTPATCSGSTCQLCRVTSVGQVGFSQRTVTQDLVLSPVSGVFCNGAVSNCRNTPTVTWELKLKNTAAIAGIGLFNLTYNTQGNNSATCAAASNCSLQLNLNSPSSGAPSTGLMGNAVLIPGSTTYPIYQTLTKPMVTTGGLAEVGVFFYGTTAPTLTGPNANPGAAAYWGDSHEAATSTTVGKNSSTGGTNDGTAPIGSPACSTPSASVQACTSWCYGGDALVLSFAGNVTLLTDQLSYVKFGTNANVGQNVLLTQVAKYPSSAITGAPKTVDAEIWYARNPNFSGASPLAVNASSYKGRGSGAAGIGWSSDNTTSISGTTLTIGNGYTKPYTGATIFPDAVGVGDEISSTGGSGGNVLCSPSCPTITAQLTSTESGGALGGRGTYTISSSQTVGTSNSRTWTIKSRTLRVTACTVCDFAAGDAWGTTSSASLGTINSQASVSNSYGYTEATGGVGRYTISGAAAYVAPTTSPIPSTSLYAGTAATFAGTASTTVYLPATSSQPLAADPAATPPRPSTLIAVKSGAGVLAPGTTVSAVQIAPNAATAAFTVSQAPTTPLNLASLCGGTCAFFVPGTNTMFSLGITSNFNEWAAGFVCMKGVDQPPQAVTSSTAFSKRWTEHVQ